MTSVYVIAAEGGPVKVGMANDPEKRLQALEAAGVEFIPENGGGPGVRLKKQEPGWH